MKIPKRIQPLIQDGFIDEVLGRLMSGKEADVFVVRCGDQDRCTKIYKDSMKRSFKKAATYNEGRKVRNSRRARAMEKKSKFGRQQQEDAWQTSEVDALRRLDEVGVRVPRTFGCLDGVLLMELIVDDAGDVAPRLGDVTMSAERAREDHATMMHYVKCMLASGVIHGDLSEFNVLIDATGPVVIDLPQAVDASANNNAETMLARDVRNITQYYGLFAPELLETKYAKEMWALYETGQLSADTPLTGTFDEPDEDADMGAVLREIASAIEEEEERQARLVEFGIK